MSPLRAKPIGLYTRQVGYLGLQGRYLGARRRERSWSIRQVFGGGSLDHASCVWPPESLLIMNEGLPAQPEENGLAWLVPPYPGHRHGGGAKSSLAVAERDWPPTGTKFFIV